jgi:hypothetical protein
MMSFSRPDVVRGLVRRLLDPDVGAPDLIGEIVLWNANPGENDLRDLQQDDKPHHYVPAGRVRVIDTWPDVGLHSRFAGALLARESVVWMQDDDLFVPAAAMRELVRRQTLEPDVIHGPFGRHPTRDSAYDYEDGPERPRAAVILTKVLVARRDLFSAFFAVAPLFDEYAAAAKPVWNGEDIVFSLAVVRRNGGKLNRKHGDLRMRVQELDDTGGVSYWAEHIKYRAFMVQKAFDLLGLELNPPDKPDQPIRVKEDVGAALERLQLAEHRVLPTHAPSNLRISPDGGGWRSNKRVSVPW